MSLSVRVPTGREQRVVRVPRRFVAGSAVAGLMLAGAVTATQASAAVPTFPDNLVVFPDRDFITVEGFQDHVGEVATVTVTRGATTIGSAKVVVEPGDVAFEINHPGGACWGAGTDLKVTPDIKAGDKVDISFADGASADIAVQDAAVTADTTVTGNTVKVTGKVGAGVNRDQLEQRIVNPDLTGTNVGRRDVRAAPGPLTSQAGGAYQSSLEFNADGTFVATYVFTDEAAARTAATGGGERVLAWQAEDADANRQGISIAEYGEVGGPGMGGCPAGPDTQAAPAGSFSVSRNGGTAVVNWTPATAQPGATAVSGYQVVAIAGTTGTGSLTGTRTAASATQATLSGLDAGTEYTFEVRSLAGTAMSAPFTRANGTTTPTQPTGDTTAPVLTVTPAGGTDAAPAEAARVSATVNEANTDIYYSVGSPAIGDGDLPSDTAKLYTGPITITAKTDLHFAAFDAANNTASARGFYAPPAAGLPAPTSVTATAGQGSASLRWAAVTGAAAYEVTNKVTGAKTEVVGTNTTITGLTAGTSYTFDVAAKSATGSAGTVGAAATSNAVTPTAVTDRVAVTSARWKTGDFRVVGTGSATGATVSVRTGSATGPVIGTATVTAPVAPATVGDWTLRLRNAAAGTRNPGQIWVTSNQGGVAGPVTVVNG